MKHKTKKYKATFPKILYVFVCALFLHFYLVSGEVFYLVYTMFIISHAILVFGLRYDLWGYPPTYNTVSKMFWSLIDAMFLPLTLIQIWRYYVHAKKDPEFTRDYISYAENENSNHIMHYLRPFQKELMIGKMLITRRFQF